MFYQIIKCQNRLNTYKHLSGICSGLMLSRLRGVGSVTCMLDLSMFLEHQKISILLDHFSPCSFHFYRRYLSFSVTGTVLSLSLSLSISISLVHALLSPTPFCSALATAFIFRMGERRKITWVTETLVFPGFLYLVTDEMANARVSAGPGFVRSPLSELMCDRECH